MVATATEILDCRVAFGNVGFGKDTVRLGIKIDRALLKVKDADRLLCGKRVNCTVKVQPSGDDPNQTYFDGIGGGAELTGVADIHRFGVSPDIISAGLTFNKRAVDGSILQDFASQIGRFVITGVDDIPEEVKEPKHKEAAPTGSLKTDRPWRKVELDNLFAGHPGLRKNLADANINTVGELVDFQKDGDQWMTKIKGIGPSAVDKISDVMEAFWRDNPQYSESESLPIEKPEGETAPAAETNGTANGKTARKKARKAAKAETNGDAHDEETPTIMGAPVAVKRGRPSKAK